MISISNNNISREKWKCFLNDSSFATPFQTPEYFDFYNSVPGLNAEVFAVEDSNELLALCIVTFQKEKGIKEYFSRRAIIYGGPLIAESEKGKIALDALLSAINLELKQKVIYAETRNFNDYSLYKECFLKNAWNYEPYINFHLDCTTEETAWKNLSTNRKRQIKKAINLGVKIEEAKDINEVNEFYKILNELYHSRVKRPLQSYNFFTLFFNKNFSAFNN